MPEGPQQSAVLRRIFRLCLNNHLPPIAIAEKLNAAGTRWLDGSPWTNQRVRRVLACDLVTGRQPYGKTAADLGGRRVDQARSAWGSVRVFPAIVSQKLFDATQARLAELGGSRVKTDAEMLDDLRTVNARQGRISLELINAASGLQRSTTYFKRFGTITEACRLAGIVYDGPRERGRSREGNRLTRPEAIEALQRLYRGHGCINMYLCQADPSVPSLRWLRLEFGGLQQAFAYAGLPHYRSPIDTAAA